MDVVGNTLEELKKVGINAKEVKVEMKDIPRAWTVNEMEGFLKVVNLRKWKDLGSKHDRRRRYRSNKYFGFSNVAFFKSSRFI